MVGGSFRRDAFSYRDLHVRTSTRAWRSPNGSTVSSPPLTPTSSAIDLTSSPSCSSCSSTPFSYLVSVQTADPQIGFHESLLPGLPDDLAVACLLRLPLRMQGIGRMVCHRWKNLLMSDDYIQARRSSGFAEPWLLVFAFNKATGKIQWQAWDATRNYWHIIAPMPSKERICPPGLRCVANAKEGTLFVCGGMCLDMDCPLDTVMKYDLHKNIWTKMGSMCVPRSFFASGMINGRIYAAGGNSSASHELSSAELYDPAEDRWRLLTSMGTSMCEYDTAVMHGKLYVTEGWSWPITTPRGQIYDPNLDTWESMTSGMLEGWTGLSVVSNGHMYVLSEREDLKLKSYEIGSDTWSNVGNAQIPPNMVLPISINAINGDLVIVGKSLHIAVGTITEDVDEDGKALRSVLWQVYNAPDKFQDFVPSHSVVVLC